MSNPDDWNEIPQKILANTAPSDTHWYPQIVTNLLIYAPAPTMSITTEKMSLSSPLVFLWKYIKRMNGIHNWYNLRLLYTLQSHTTFKCNTEST